MNEVLAADTADLDHMWDFSHPDWTEVRFREALGSLNAAAQTERSPSLKIELLSQIARAQGLQAKFIEAEATLTECEAVLEGYADTCSVRAKVRFLLEKGRILYLAKTPARAHALFLESWTLASQAGEDFLAIDVAQMMALIESPKLQKDWTLKALGLAESSTEPRAKRWLGALYSSLGWHFYELRQYDKALELFNKALSRLEAELNASLSKSIEDATLMKRILMAKWAVGKTYRVQGKVGDALKIQEDLFAELSRSGSKDGYVYEEMAECLTSLKRANEAELYFEFAYAELSKDEWLSDNKPERIKRLKTLGKVK